jgi:hypothetical protein
MTLPGGSRLGPYEILGLSSGRDGGSVSGGGHAAEAGRGDQGAASAFIGRRRPTPELDRTVAIDPDFDPLRNNPRFQKLVAGAK